MKRRGRKWIAGMLLFAMAAGAVSTPVSAAKKTGRISNNLTVTIKAGKTKKLKIVGGQKAGRIKWSVKNRKIAKIVKKTKKTICIKGLKAGSTLITGQAYIGGKLKKLKIKVKVWKASKKKKEVQETPVGTVPASPAAPTLPTSEMGLKTTEKPNSGTPTVNAEPTDPIPTAKVTAIAGTTTFPESTAIPGNTEEPDYDAKEDYDLLAGKTTILPKGAINAAKQPPVSNIDTFRIEGGKLIGTYNASNSSIVLDLGASIDVNRYKGVEISGICPGSVAIEFYGPDFDMFVSKDNGYEKNWWETSVGRAYPFYRGTSSWRYENGSMNRLKAIQNNCILPGEKPEDLKSAAPTEERIRYSLADMTNETGSGDWSNVRYIVVRSNNIPYLPQTTFKENNPLQYQITGFKFLAEEVIDAKTEAHYLMYNAEQADTEKNVAFTEGNITSYYVDTITDTNPADKRDTTKNLSDFRFVKVKVSEGTRSVKVGLVTDGSTVADTRIIGQETGAVGDIGTKARSVYVSLEGIEKDILKNVDQITVEADGGKVTWLSATKGVINYSKAGKKLEDKVEITMDEENQGKFKERQVTESEDGDEGA